MGPSHWIFLGNPFHTPPTLDPFHGGFEDAKFRGALLIVVKNDSQHTGLDLLDVRPRVVVAHGLKLVQEVIGIGLCKPLCRGDI